MNEIKTCFHPSLQLSLQGLQQRNAISQGSSSCLGWFQSAVNLRAPLEQHGHPTTDLSQGQLKRCAFQAVLGKARFNSHSPAYEKVDTAADIWALGLIPADTELII